MLKPYLLRLREEHGEDAVRELCAAAGIAIDPFQQETEWISVAVARRALALLEKKLGPGAIADRGAYMEHPENLGAYVRVLRTAKRPADAYQKLCENAREASRVGDLRFEKLGPRRVKIRFVPIEGDEAPPPDKLISAARKAELAGIPRLWGLPDARVEVTSSTASGDRESTYLLAWKAGRAPYAIPIASVLGLLVSGAPIAVVGGPLAGGIGALTGLALGAVIGLLYDRALGERQARIFEKNRIAALERGLELRGHSEVQSASAPGELTGTVLGGKYRIEQKIGSGGIGAIYSAEHVSLGHQVAVKVLRGAAAKDAAEIARLRREAQVQVSIHHANVVQTLDLDQMPDGSLYVVMELLRGRTLSDKMNREGPIAPGFAIPAFRQVCKGLQAAHEKGVVHRDMKPGNIFLCEDGVVKVLDFGMSKFQSAESLTQDGYTLGTPEYMAPEQCIGAEVGARTDLYSFGVLMYEALTGELPIQAPNRRDLLDMHQKQIPTSMRERRPDLPIPEALDEAVLQCLKKKMRDRPASAAALDELLAAVPIAGSPSTYPRGTARTAASARRGLGSGV